MATLYVFNAGTATANIAAQWLNNAGTNLAGLPVAGASPLSPGDPTPVYPGQVGGATVPLAPNGTFIQEWQTANAVDPAAGGNVAISIRVTSDQPIAAGTNIIFSGFARVPCSQVLP